MSKHNVSENRGKMVVRLGVPLAAAVVLVSSLALSQQWTEFQGGQPAKASEVNENFDIVAPPGAVIAYVGNTAPAGWLLCDGQTVDAATYPALAAAMGESGSFSLPDMMDQFIRGKASAGAAMTSGGTPSITTPVSHTHSISSSGTHRHSLRVGDSAGIGNWGDGATRSNSGNSDAGWYVPHQFAAIDGAHIHTTANAAGGISPVTNLPPYRTMNYIIKI